MAAEITPIARRRPVLRPPSYGRAAAAGRGGGGSAHARGRLISRMCRIFQRFLLEWVLHENAAATTKKQATRELKCRATSARTRNATSKASPRALRRRAAH